MKVFISQPMNGKTDEEIMKERDRVTEKLKRMFPDETIEILDTFIHENVPENAGRIWHLGESIKMMEQADLVYFAGDWRNAKGCQVECAVAAAYDLKIMSE